MQEKSKILILSTNYLPFLGGSELAIKNITDRIGDFEFDLVTGNFSKNLPKHEKLGNVNVYRVGGRFNSANILLPKIFLPIAVFFEVIKLIRNNNYIVMHAFQASQAAGGGLLASLFYPKIPFILSFQEGKELDNQNVITRFLRRLILNNLDRATAISEYLKKYIQEKELVKQSCEKLKEIALQENWVKEMFGYLEKEGKKEFRAGEDFIQKINQELAEIQNKLDKKRKNE